MKHISDAVYSVNDIRSLDAAAQGLRGLDAYALMQAAANAAWQLLQTTWPQARALTVLVGAGNNGGDGYVLALLAQQAGWSVQVLAIAPVRAGITATKAADAWQEAGGQVILATMETLVTADAQSVLVDAIYGVGLARMLSAELQALIVQTQHQSWLGVIALDVPSGLCADTGSVRGAAIKADITITFIGHKLGLLTGEGPEHVGQLHLADLNLPRYLYAQHSVCAQMLRAESIPELLPKRSRSSHKGHFGHARIIGGDYGMAGAVLLVARAALRSGAGLVSVYTRPEHAFALQAAQPEVMFNALMTQDTPTGHYNAIAIGPGLGTHRWGVDAVAQLLTQVLPLPSVWDADALNVLAMAPHRLECGIITPHPGEAGRLLGISTAEVQANRLSAAQALRSRYGAVVVLKGAGTLVVGTQTWVCPYGNPGMAVGGSGDALTGVIVALLAQGLEPQDAARLGVLIHAQAGDAAAHANGERGMLPSDLIDQLRFMVNPHD